MTGIIIEIVAIFVLLAVNGGFAMTEMPPFRPGGCGLNTSPIKAMNAKDR